MNITFVLANYPLTPSGGMRVIYEHANQLCERGHCVSLVHPTGVRLNVPSAKRLRVLRSWWRGQLLRRATRHLQVPRERPNWQFIDPRVRMIYLKGEPISAYIPDGDVVIATAWETAPYVDNYPTSKGTKFHYVADYERWITADDEARSLMGEAFALKSTKLALSQVSINMIETYNTNSSKYIVPISIDHSMYRIIKPIGQRDPMRLSMAYRVPQHKGIADGLEALRIVHKSYPDIQADLFGSSQMQYSLEPWMNYIYKPSNEDIVRIYNHSSVFVVSSWAEGWGLPGMEAMACGATLCSTDTGGVHEYAIHNRNALISPPHRPDILAQNIINLIADQKMRKNLAEQGIKDVQQFTWNRAAELFDQYLLSV